MARALKVAKGNPAAPPKILDNSLFDEIDGLINVGKSVLIREDDGIEIPADNLDMAVNLITMSRALAIETDKIYKSKLTQIMEPVNLKVSQVQKEKKSIVGRAEELAKEVESGLQDLISDGILTDDGYISKAGCRLTLIGKDALRVIDASKISDEYLLPREKCIDWTKVHGVLAAEKAYRETLPENVPAPASNIQGAELVRTYTFRTKLPEEVE